MKRMGMGNDNVIRKHHEHHEPGRFRRFLRRGPLDRRFLRIGVIIGILIIVLTVLLAVLPSIPPFKQYILSFVNRQASSQLSCKVSLGAIFFDISKGLVVKNIVLSDSLDKAMPLTVERVEVRIDLVALLKKRVELRSIKFAGFTGELLKTHQGLFLGPVDIGRLTAPDPQKPKKKDVNPKPPVRMISAERCTVSFIDSVTGLTASETINSARLDFIRADSMIFVMQAGAGHLSSPVWSGGLRSIDVQGNAGPAFLRINQAEVRGDSVSVSLSGTIPLSMENAWDLTANAETFVAGFPALLKKVPSFKPVGKLKVKGVMTGTFAHPVLDATFTGYGLVAGPVAADSLFLQAQYSDDRLHGKARFWSPSGTADASVRAVVSGMLSSPAIGSYTIEASAGNVDIRHFISTLPRPRHEPAFLIDAGLYAVGSGIQQLPDSLSADIRESKGTTSANPVNVTVRLAGNTWDLTAALKPDCEVIGKGKYNAHGEINGSIHVQADSIARIASIFSDETVSGSITADAQISGNISNPTVTAAVQSDKLQWRDVWVSKLWGRFTLRNKEMVIDTSFIAANGSMASALRGLVPGEINGNARVQAGGSGRIDSLRFSGDLQIGRCSYGRYRADTVFAHCRYTDQNLRWQSLTVKRGKSAILSNGAFLSAKGNVSVNADCQFTFDNRAAGSLSTIARFLNHSVEASVKVEDFDPSVVTPWFPQAERLQGSLGAHGTMKGTSENPDIRLNFSLDHAVSNGLVLTTTGDLALTNSIATATINAVQKGSEIPLTITAHLPVSLRELSKGIAAMRDGAVVTVNGDSVAYGGLINAFVPSVRSLGIISLHGKLLKADGEWGLSFNTHVINHRLTVRRERIKAGRAVLDLQIDGPLVRPAARFTLSGDSIEYRRNLIAAYSVDGSMVNEVLKLDTLHLSGGGGSADLSAIIPVTLKNGFSFYLNKDSRFSATFAEMPLSLLQPFMPDPVTIQQGEISGKVVVEGIVDGVPQATGTLSLRDGECDLLECDQPLGPLFADIEFKNGSIILRKLQADWGGGSIEGSGSAALGANGVSSAQSVINLRDVRLGGCTENLDLGIQTGDINLTMDSSSAVINVNALLAETRFTQDLSLIDIGVGMNSKTPLSLKPPNPLFDHVVMRIAVNLNSNLTFDSNLGKMLIDGTVTVAGRPDKPSIAGQFQILNGFVYYLDRKFTVTQGAIRQYDPQRINPSFDLTAVSSVSWYPPQGGNEDYEITLQIKGDLSNPIVSLSSVPSLPQPQIISLLTFGTIQMGAGTELGPRTGSLLSQQLAGFGTRKLARFLNLESVDLYGNVFGSSSEGPQLAVTKQVSTRVVVYYKTGLSTLSQQMILVSYRLLPFLYLEAQTDQQAQSGVDLKFRYSR